MPTSMWLLPTLPAAHAGADRYSGHPPATGSHYSTRSAAALLQWQQTVKRTCARAVVLEVTARARDPMASPTGLLVNHPREKGRLGSGGDRATKHIAGLWLWSKAPCG